ncbi:ComF family protein [uncultured Rhodoferax sp.]|uniref:ComF family protein n=1 Tax=uncultured Rhodoferax sp. TaxID=223188 RepID=UPI0025CDC63A|nr:ComF family protein [uncultured Rhodoferax sp.]
MFRQLLQGVSQRLPSQCVVCHAWPAQPVCEDCVAEFAQPVHRCTHCALPLPAGMPRCGACVTRPPPWDRALAAVSYAYPWSGLVVDLKFHAHPAWAGTLATLLRSTPWVEPALEAADYLLPLPLSEQRLRSRGFNQAQEIARQLAPHKLRDDLLLRVRDTPPQSSLPRHERLRSVQGAFVVEPLRARELAGKTVVLVDDVMTSGASLHAASMVLRNAGVTHITVLVFARTE